jgi:hypothetical protein
VGVSSSVLRRMRATLSSMHAEEEGEGRMDVSLRSLVIIGCTLSPTDAATEELGPLLLNSTEYCLKFMCMFGVATKVIPFYSHLMF